MPIQLESNPVPVNRPIAIAAAEMPRMVAVCQSIANAALHSNDVMQIFDMAVANLGEVLKLDMVRIYLFDIETASLIPKAQFARFTAGCPITYPARLGKAIVEMVAASGQAAIFENPADNPFFDGLYDSRTTGQYPCGFFAAFPMRGKVNHSGVLVCANRRARELGTMERDFIETIVDLLSVAQNYFRLSARLASAQRELHGRSSEHDPQGPTRGQIAEFVSCEVRSRLTSILGYVQLLQEQYLGQINAKQANALDTIASESGNLLETLIGSIEGCPDILPRN